MKLFKDDGKERISAESPKEVTLEFVLREIDELPLEYEGNFIGIINEKDETLNFLRCEENCWVIDVSSLLENGTISYQQDYLTTEQVKKIVRKFFSGENWKNLCNLRDLQRKPKPPENKRRIECFREIGDKGAEFVSEEILSKEEFIKKLENHSNSSEDITYGIFAELSKPYIMIKNQNGKWQVMLDLENPNVEVSESDRENEPMDYEEIDNIKEWVNQKF